MGKYSAKTWTDENLLDLIRQHDDLSAFSELYLRYWDVLLDAAYQRLKSEEAAEDLVQQLFMDFFIRRREIIISSSVPAYLKTALKHQVFNAYRAQKVRENYASTIGPESSYSKGPDDILEGKELQQRILEFASTLPEKCREVFVLSRLEQHSQQEIATRLGISVSTVKKHLHKASVLLRSQFGDQYVELVIVCTAVFFASNQ